MKKVYKIGTRTSPLALKQVEEVVEALRAFYSSREVDVDVVGIDAYGDKDTVTSISKMEGTDFFTREIDEALLGGEVDIAVHSAKDLPDEMPEGLVIAALTPGVDPCDVLVSKSGLTLDELPVGAKVGTSSQRRKDQLRKYRNDLQIVDIRGNIIQRLEKLDNSDLDTVLIAAAGLIRLGLEDRITQRIPVEIMRPHPMQGVLAIVIRKENTELFDFLSVLSGQCV